MGLEEFWFVLIGVLWAGYFLLEGFDFGVGMLLPVLPRDERERGLMFQSIGPVWDGNEVWLVVAAGATFAAFPAWYATMFSGFYIALLLILVLLIVRVVSFEWREKRDTPRWRAGWLWANTIGSAGAAFIWGVALANLIHGLALDSSHVFTGNVLDLFSPYTVLAGLAVVSIFAAHGATYLTLRLSGDFCERAAAMSKRLSVPAALLGIAIVAWTVAVAHDRNSRSVLPVAVPAALTAIALDTGHGTHTRRPRRLGLRGDRPGRDRLRRDHLHRPVSARARLTPSVRQQPHDLQRRGRALRAVRDHGRRRDLHADRPPLPGVDLPRVPGRGSGARRAETMRALDPRLVDRTRSVRPLLAVDTALGAATVVPILAAGHAAGADRGGRVRRRDAA